MPELDLGNVKGPQGKSAYQSALDAGYSGSEEAFNTAMAKAPDAVLYTPQSLSDAQKTQARTNINAAPGGFGLGGLVATIPANANLNDYINTGFWGSVSTTTIHTWVNTPANWPANEAILEVYSVASNYVIQRLSSVTTKVSAQRFLIGGVWSEWEWINPPMELNIEYCTTERHLNQPVYCKVLEFSTITDGEQVDIGVSQILRANVYEVYGSYYIPVPQVPFLMQSTSLPHANGMAYFTNIHSIAFVRGANNGSTKVVATVYYTK